MNRLITLLPAGNFGPGTNFLTLHTGLNDGLNFALGMTQGHNIDTVLLIQNKVANDPVFP